MNRKPWMVLVFLLSMIAAGCARQVVRTADFGVVAMPSNTNLVWPFDYRNQAEGMMGSHFPEGYVVEREEETVVGQTVDTQQDHTTNQLFPALWPFNIETGTTQTTQTTSDNTEWRIYYRRAGRSQLSERRRPEAGVRGDFIIDEERERRQQVELTSGEQKVTR